MILFRVFPGDDDQLLKDVQWEEYGEHVGVLCSSVAEAYARAEDTVQQGTMLGKLIRQRKTFDHRVLQGAHDRIAAGYRKCFAPAKAEEADTPERKERLRGEWLAGFRAQLRDLCEQPEFTRNAVIAVLQQNNGVGLRAEHALKDLLVGHYGLPDRYDPEKVDPPTRILEFSDRRDRRDLRHGEDEVRNGVP